MLQFLFDAVIIKDVDEVKGNYNLKIPLAALPSLGGVSPLKRHQALLCRQHNTVSLILKSQ